MSFAKRLIEEQEEQEEQHRAAVRIALKAGVLKSCEFHGEVYDPLGGDNQAAYMLGNAMFTRGELPMFSDRRTMTDAIKDAIDDTGMECSSCANLLED